MGTFFDHSKNEGWNIHISKILQYLKKNNHDVELITVPVKKSQFHRSNKRRLYDFFFRAISLIPAWTVKGSILSLEVFRQCAKERRFDILHERYVLYSIGGVLASRRSGIPLVLEVNAPLIEELALFNVKLRFLDKKCAAYYTKLCFGHATAIIAVSNMIRDYLINRWDVDPEKIYVIPNAADTDFSVKRIDGDNTRSKYSIAPTDPVVVFIGSMKKWHGIDILIDAFIHVLGEVPDAKLLLVGEGEMRDEIEKKINDSNIKRSVVLTGNVTHDAIPEILSISDVAVAPYPRMDNFYFSPIKIFEYMISGKAIVASGIGQIPELVQNNINGILVEPENIGQLSKAIVRLLKDDDLRLFLGKNAQREAFNKYTWEQYSRRLIEIYYGSFNHRVNSA